MSADKAIRHIQAIGNIDLLLQSPFALVCSIRCPGAAILKTYELAQRLKLTDRTVIGGFHSPMEQECLHILLGGRCPIIVCPARGIGTMRVPRLWRLAVCSGRMLIASAFDPMQKRATKELAAERNHFVASLAHEILIPFAAPGSSTEQLARDLIAQGKPVFTFCGESGSNLLSIGAAPVGDNVRFWLPGEPLSSLHTTPDDRL